ncbi:Calcium-transporting ATPase type 2C member 1 [Geodia barretti]|uniref:P-type Ca(2+) transporter n=1 Tax=Geodia barretti TaxID=519541 RepID=A0AA35RSE6_GEOBA|nr:Calcium-transporting ATPase type 2C member 1 [Geodia barretti]
MSCSISFDGVLPCAMRASEAAVSTATDVVSRLGADISAGLTAEEVERRRKAFGRNEFTIKEEEPLSKKYLNQFNDPLILLLLASAIISLIARQLDDAFSITVAIVIVVTVAFVQEYRSERSLEALSQLIPPKCHCVRSGIMQEMLAGDLVPGDTVNISLGDRVPADIRLTEVVDLEVDESSFTGETIPSRKSTLPQSAACKGVSQLKNIAFMGTFVCSGHGKGVVIGVGEDSEFGSVFRMMQNEESPKTPLQKSMSTLGKQLSFYSLLIIGCIMLLGWLQGRHLLAMFTIGVSLAVAAIPEGLPIVVTVTLALGVIRMAGRHAIVKRLPIVETLGCVNVVCSDKTGTLTENKMEVTRLYTASRQRASVGKTGAVDCEGCVVSPSSHPDIVKMIEVGCVCNNAQLRGGQIIGHPTEGAMLALAHKLNLFGLRDQFVRTEERTFSSEKKWMGVLVRPRSHQVTEPPSKNEDWYMKGALDVVLRHCTTISGGGLLTPSLHEHYMSVASEYGHQGLRVVAMAYGRDLNDLSFAGLMAMWDPPRENVRDAIANLHSSGVSVKMITGDAKETGEAIGKKTLSVTCFVERTTFPLPSSLFIG